MKQNIINHIALVIDRSGSMYHLINDVVNVADAQIKHLADRSRQLDQETRITVYIFDDRVECLFYDKDVLRMPSLKGLVRPGGNTALVGATLKAIEDLQQTPELYGDHAFLTYVLTDGGENASGYRASDQLSKAFVSMKDNWTVAVFVPNQTGKFEAKKFGFPADNIAVWDVGAKGLAEVGRVIRETTETFMRGRSTGVRGSRNLFNVSAPTKAAVASVLPKLHPGQYRVFDVKEDGPIAPFVEKKTKRAYVSGEAFYQLSKSEKVQAQKAVALYDRKTHAVYTGDAAREMLSLPDYEVRVAPAHLPDFDIFIQSTSVNRKLIAGTKLLILS